VQPASDFAPDDVEAFDGNYRVLTKGLEASIQADRKVFEASKAELESKVASLPVTVYFDSDSRPTGLQIKIDDSATAEQQRRVTGIHRWHEAEKALAYEGVDVQKSAELSGWDSYFPLEREMAESNGSGANSYIVNNPSQVARENPEILLNHAANVVGKRLIAERAKLPVLEEKPTGVGRVVDYIMNIARRSLGPLGS